MTATIDLETGPTDVTYAPYTVNAASKTATPEMRGCGGVFDETYALTAVESGQSALPAFMSFEASTGVITVTPTDEAHQGVYVIEVLQDNAYGEDITWDAIEVSVGCLIGSITVDDPPATQTISLYDAPTFIDLTAWAYTQSPPCGFTVADAFEWTIPADAPIQSVATGTSRQLTVQSSSKADVGTFAVTLRNTMTDSNEVADVLGTTQEFIQDVSFDIIVIDPCDTTEITAIALAAIEVVNGETQTVTFDRATDSVEMANEDQPLCGARSYRIYREGGSEVEVTDDWITIDDNHDGTFTLTVAPIDDALVDLAQPLALRLETRLTDQPDHAGLDETFAVKIVFAPCDCGLLTWDLPASMPATLLVGVSATDTLAIEEATPNEESKTLTPAIRKCYQSSSQEAASCDHTYTNALVDSTLAVLPSFMTYAGTDLTVSPTVAADIGVYNLELTMTTASGEDQTYIAAIITVDCTVTAIDDPAAPTTDLTYNIYDANLFIDLVARGTVYTQTPPCEHVGSQDFAWTIPADSGISEFSDMTLSVVSDDRDLASTYTVTLVNTISFDSTVPNNDGDSFTPTITFDITVIDPCTTTVINAIAIDPITMLNGVEKTVDFLEATVSVEEENNGLYLCGPREYLIVDADGNAIAWLPITGSRDAGYTLTATPTDDALVTGGSLSYFLKVTLTNYPTPLLEQPLSVTISAAVCECELLLWDDPVAITQQVDVALGPTAVTIPSATPNAASKLPTAQIRACYADGAACPETSTYAAIHVASGVLPDFITQDAATDALTVTPTLAVHRGTWVLQITQTTASGEDRTFDGVTIEVGCTITDVPSPSPPTSESHQLTFTLYSTTLFIDVSDILYVQDPPCEYDVTHDFVWEISDPLVIYESPQSGQTIMVDTNDKSKLGPHTVTLTDNISFSGGFPAQTGSWSPEYTFSVTVEDPCEGTALIAFTVPPIEVVNGFIGTHSFGEVTDTREVEEGIDTLCSTRTYEITYQDSQENADGVAGGSIDWVTVALDAEAGVDMYTITAEPTLDSLAGTHNLRLTMSLDDYSGVAPLEVNFVVLVTTPTCDCTLITWDPPAA